MPNVTGHTELVGLMAYPIRHTQSPTTHNLAYDKNGDDVIQLAFEVDNDSLKDAVQSIRALKMIQHLHAEQNCCSQISGRS
jgi:shikimate 5-dehydrogenase